MMSQTQKYEMQIGKQIIGLNSCIFTAKVIRYTVRRVKLNTVRYKSFRTKIVYNKTP